MNSPSTTPSRALAPDDATASPSQRHSNESHADAAPATIELKPHSPRTSRVGRNGGASAAAALPARPSTRGAVGSADAASSGGPATAGGGGGGGIGGNSHRQSVSPQVPRFGRGANAVTRDDNRSLAGSQKDDAAPAAAGKKEAVMPPPPPATAGAYSPPGGHASTRAARQHRRVPPPTDTPYEFLNAAGAPLRHQHAPANGPTVGQALASHFRTRSSWAGSEVLSTVERYLNGVYRPPVPSVFAKRAAGSGAAAASIGGSSRKEGGDFSPSGSPGPRTTAARDFLLPATFLSTPGSNAAAGGSTRVRGRAERQPHNGGGNHSLNSLATFGVPASPTDEGYNRGDTAAASAPVLLLRPANAGRSSAAAAGGGSLPDRSLYSTEGGPLTGPAPLLSLSASTGNLARARSAAAAATGDDSAGPDGTGCPSHPVSYAQSFGRRLRAAARVGREEGLAAAAAALFRRWPSAPAVRSSPVTPGAAGAGPADQRGGTTAVAADDELSEEEVTAPLTPTNRRRPIPMIPDIDTPSAPAPPSLRVLSLLDGQTGQPVPVWSSTCSIPVPQPTPVFVSSSPSSPSSPRPAKNATKPLVFVVTTAPVSAVTRMGHGSVSARGACGVLMTSATTVREAVTRLPEAKCPSLHPALTAALTSQIEELLAAAAPPLGSESAARAATSRPLVDMDGIRVHDGAAPLPKPMSPSALRDKNLAGGSRNSFGREEGVGLVPAGSGAAAAGHLHHVTSPTDAAGAAFAQLTNVLSPVAPVASRRTLTEIMHEEAATSVPAPPLVPLVAFTAAVCGSVPQLRAAMADVRTSLGTAVHNYQPMPPPAPVEGLGLTPANDGTPEDAFTAAAVAARADWMWSAPAAAVALGADAPQRTLMSMGFDRRHADAALCLARGSLPAACALLTDTAWRVDEFLSGAVGADASDTGGAAASPGAGSVSSPMLGVRTHGVLPSPHPHPIAGGAGASNVAGSSDAAALPPAVSTPTWDHAARTSSHPAFSSAQHDAASAAASVAQPPRGNNVQSPHPQLEAATSTVRLPSDEEAYLFAVVSGRAREAPPAPATVDGEAWLSMLQEYVRSSCGRHPQCGSLTSALAQGVVTPELVVETALLALQAPMEFHKLRLCGTRAHRILMLQWCRMFAEAAPGSATV